MVTKQNYNELLNECKTLCKEFNSQEVELVFNLNDIEIDGDVSVTTTVGLVPELTGCSYVYNKTLDCSLLGMDIRRTYQKESTFELIEPIEENSSYIDIIKFMFENDLYEVFVSNEVR